MKHIDFAQLRAYCFADFDAFARMNPAIELRENKYGRHLFWDRGASVLAVAHLDTVQDKKHLTMERVKNELRVYNAQLDDRLGAYIIANYLPSIGIQCDLLLTEHEEICNSTAQDFAPSKQYNWCFMFDRAGDDVVMYQFEDNEAVARVESCGARVGIGSYSCIAELSHLGVKCFNWGAGYHNNHSLNSYMTVKETLRSIKRFAAFYQMYADVHMPHDPATEYDYLYGASGYNYRDYRVPFDGMERCLECEQYTESKYFNADYQLCHECLDWYLFDNRITEQEEMNHGGCDQ